LSFLVATNTIDAETLPAFGLSRRLNGRVYGHWEDAEKQRNGAMTAFITMQQRYAARLRLLASDRAHWDMLRPRAPLIDWTLLALTVALLRHQSKIITVDDISSFAQGTRTSDINEFVTELARLIYSPPLQKAQ
jgi:hypothetical protein